MATKTKPTRNIESRNDARKAAQRVIEISDQVKAFNEEVEKLAAKRGISEMRQEIPILNGRILNFMQKQGMTRLDLGEDFGYVNFIQATGEHVWVSTTADIPENAPKGVKSLRKLLGKELWLKVTKRVVDPKKIEALIEDGEITEDQVAPAHFTRKRAPYIRYEGRR